MEVDEDVDVENSEGASLPDGDVRACPHSQAEELNDHTGHSMVSKIGQKPH
jgi:hypothetical protein